VRGDCASTLGPQPRQRNANNRKFLRCAHPRISDRQRGREVEAGGPQSRLIEEFHARLGDTPHTWVEWSCSQLLQNTSLHPIAEWGRQRFGSADIAVERRLSDLENTLALIKLDPAENTPLLAPLLDLLSDRYPLDRRRLGHGHGPCRLFRWSACRRFACGARLVDGGHFCCHSCAGAPCRNDHGGGRPRQTGLSCGDQTAWPSPSCSSSLG
jgi:hypothetical protein